jgi:hypothetical protein
LLRIDARQGRPEPRRDHRPDQSGGIRELPPERARRLDPGEVQLPPLIAADVRQVEVAVREDPDVFRSCPRENVLHPPIVGCVGVRPWEQDPPERQLSRRCLVMDELPPHTMHGDPSDRLAERSDEPDDVDFALLSEDVQRPRAVPLNVWYPRVFSPLDRATPSGTSAPVAR